MSILLVLLKDKIHTVSTVSINVSRQVDTSLRDTSPRVNRPPLERKSRLSRVECGRKAIDTLFNALAYRR